MASELLAAAALVAFLLLLRSVFVHGEMHAIRDGSCARNAMFLARIASKVRETTKGENLFDGKTSIFGICARRGTGMLKVTVVSKCELAEVNQKYRLPPLV